MTECKKCGKAYSEDFLFCPYCGKKKDNVGKEKENLVTMAMFLAFCRDDDFVHRLAKASREGELETPEKIALFLRRPIDPVVVWGIGIKHHGPSWKETVVEKQGNISAAGLQREMERGRLVDAWPVEKTLLKSYLGKMGTTYFWTKEECQQAIDGALNKG